jgi:hypothetical protein
VNESVYVEYPSSRDVFVDGQLCGKTKQLMIVQTGTHMFDLGNPQDYTPDSISRQVVHFDPKA